MQLPEPLSLNEPASPQAIEALESALGCPLPCEYRRFLGLHDGGYFAADFIDRSRVPGLPSSIVAETFLTVAEVQEYSLDTYKGRIPANSACFAEDGGGNLLLIVLSGEEEGTVLFWDHESEPLAFELIGQKKPENLEHLFKVSSSFSGFLEMLESS